MSFPDEVTESNREKPRSAGKLKRFLPWILGIVAIAGIGAGLYFWNESRGLQGNPQQDAEVESEEIIARVGELIVLPEGEIATIATVTDPEQLASQPFFANAEIGDKVLIYSIARKAILYRPSTHKIIEVAPLTSGGQTPQQGAEAGEQQAE